MTNNAVEAARTVSAQGREFWPHQEWLEIMGWPTDELEILGVPTRLDYDSPNSQPWDQQGLGKAIRGLAASYGFKQTRIDRDTHANLTFVEVGYSHQTVTFRWGTEGKDVLEGRRDFIRSPLSLEDRDWLDRTIKELSTRD